MMKNSKKKPGNSKFKSSAKKQLIVESVNGGLTKKKLKKPTSIPAGSPQDGLKQFEWVISPMKSSTFFQDYWEKKPCLIQRGDKRNYYSHLISFKAIDEMLNNNHIEFTKNLDVTLYKDGVRETMNPEGRALPSNVWPFYADGCSVRLLNPQTYMKNIYKLNATIQEYFHCMIGTNAYLTPPGSQGFAPHYDDIEAFVLQVEGSKIWRLYDPRTPSEELPRFSSHNFTNKDIGKPILEVTLNPGDILYFPRGVIHQAQTKSDAHSLHITLSVYQKQSYADFFEQLFPLILNQSIANNVDIRRGLPTNIWKTLGFVNSKTKTAERTEVVKNIKKLLVQCLENAPLDDAIDQLAKRFHHDALPPAIEEDEQRKTVFGVKNQLDAEGHLVEPVFITPVTKVRLLRGNICRLVREEGVYRLYFYVDNSKEYHEYEVNFIEVEDEDVNCIKKLIQSYPTYLSVEDLPHSEDEFKVAIVESLWSRGLLICEEDVVE